MGQFRVLFGLLLLYAVINDPPFAQPAETHRNYSWLADWPWVHAMASSATACRSLHLFTLWFGAFFIAGVWTRVAYVGFVVGIFLARLVQLQTRGTHDWDLPLITLLALTAVPWGDGFSVDALWRGRRGGESRAGQVYGLAIWIPGLMLGLALAAAAYAKLTRGGLAWITSGAVRYHFVEDARQAPFELGLWVASHPNAAVLLSLGAILVEAVFILNVFTRSIAWRLVFGLIGISLFGALYVFQGILWLPWLVMFSAFLPWQVLDRGRTVSRDPAPLRWWHGAVIGVFVLQQIVVSVRAIEIEPLFSNYPMYAHTHESTDAFERARHRNQQRLFFESGGTDITTRVQEIANGPSRLFEAAEALAEGRALENEPLTLLAGLRDEYRLRFGADIDVVTVIAERIAFDWERGVFKPPARVTIARVPLPARVASGMQRLAGNRD